MATPMAQKLKIREGSTILTINAPADFKKKLAPLPPGIKISTDSKNYDQVHWFVMNKADLDKQLNKVLKLLRDNVLLWIYYPKGSSKIQTDLTRDKGWDSLLKSDNLTWISLISFDDTWSTFGSRLKTPADRKKDQGQQERPIFDYVDPKTKTVRLPDDFASALKQNKSLQEFFNKLSFTNKKEYIEWIIIAKKEETRIQRVQAVMERLAMGWRNPRNI